MYDKGDAYDFLENVNTITKRFYDILEGKIYVMEEEKRFSEEEKLKVVKEEIKQGEQKEKLAKAI